MGAISEKLVYLNGTKQAIKQAINEDFEVIDNNTTFREYADEISSNNAKYKDLIPKETKNATNTLDISNSAGLDKALVTLYGNTYQETTTGKNLLPNEITTQTTSGITITKNEDGSLTINGSTTAGVRLNFASSLTLQAGTYMVSTKETSSSQGYFSFYEGSTEIFVMSFRSQANKRFTLNEETTIRPTIYISNNGTFNNYTIYPMLEQGTTATDYEPYTNGASPNPDYPQEIQVVTGDNTIIVSNSDNTQSQSYPISLGNIELCKISTYKDRIYPLNGKWYLEKQIGKVVLDGSENWNNFNIEPSGLGRAMVSSSNVYYNSTQNTIMANNMVGVQYSGSWNKTYDCIATLSNNRFIVYLKNASDLSTFKYILSNSNSIVYYALATPTTEEITESNYPTLYNQLNNIKLFEGVNHITMTNESGLDVEFDITYYKDWKLD